MWWGGECGIISKCYAVEWGECVGWCGCDGCGADGVNGGSGGIW